MAQEKINYVEMADADLKTFFEGKSAEYFQTKFDHTIKGLGNPMELREMRRNVARAQTEMRRRELAQFTPDQISMRSKIRARRRRQA